MTIAARENGAGRRPVVAAIGQGPASPRWLLSYYLVQILCQLALLTSWLSNARVLFRSSAYGMSLVALALTASRPAGRRQPAAPLALVVFLILSLEAFHPETGSALGALATVAMYASILGPLFWIPRLDMDLKWFRATVLMVWSFQSLSALVGVLQAYFPGSFQPAVSTLFQDRAYLSGLQITLSNGEQIFRPSGLTDIPGGAAAAGTYAILLALGLWADTKSKWFRAVLTVSIGVGMFSLYICEVRSLVVMVAISILAMATVLLVRGRLRSLASMAMILAAIGAVAFVAAVSVGGDEVIRRLSTLTAASPTDVYYTNRGIFLEHTLTDLLPQYPLGAGLGRWGMVAGYFSGAAAASTFIYVEIQWTGWLLDGGLLLIFVYTAMLALTVRAVWRVAKREKGTPHESDLMTWAAMLIGFDFGTIALTFNFPAFMSGFGMDFWLLNTALLVVADMQSKRPLTVNEKSAEF